MKFLQNIPPYLFFTGKGGVGMKWHTEFGHLNRGDIITSQSKQVTL